MARPKALWVLAAAALLGLSSTCRACSDVILSPTNQQPGNPAISAVVSGRHLDWYPLDSQPIHVVSVAAGTKLDAMPANGCSLSEGQTQARADKLAPLLTARHAFVCFTLARPTFTAAFRKVCPKHSLASWPGVCFDGMNTAGLSVGMLSHPSAPRPPADKFAQDSKLNLVWTDFPQILLANYASVGEVKGAVNPGTARMVTSQAVERISSTLMGPNHALPMVHFIVHDRSGATAVIEAYTAPDGAFAWHVLDNPSGVTTNAPRLEEHLAYVKAWKVAAVKEHGAVNGSLVLPGHCSGPAGSIGAPTAAYCDSAFRFANLALIKEATFGSFPNPKYALNPRNSPDPSHAAYSAVMALLSRVVVPGSWPAAASNTYSHGETTLLQLLRDHRNSTYFVRSYGNMRWSQLPVGQLAATKVKGSAAAQGLPAAPLAAVAPVTMPWADNRAAVFAAAAAQAA